MKFLLFVFLFPAGLMAQGQNATQMYRHHLDAVYGTQPVLIAQARPSAPQNDEHVGPVTSVRPLTRRAQTGQPASPEDVRKAVRDLKGVISESQKKSASRTEEAVRQNTDRSVSAVREAEARLRQDLEHSAREAKEIEAARQAHMIRMVTIIGICGALVVVGFFVIVLLFPRKTRGNAQPASEFLVPPISQEAGQRLAPEPVVTNIKPIDYMVDPDAQELKKWSEEHGNVKQVPFILTLPEQGGARLNCVAQLREGFPPVVYIEKEVDPVSWDKRRKVARQVHDRRTSVTS